MLLVEEVLFVRFLIEAVRNLLSSHAPESQKKMKFPVAKIVFPQLVK
jgi:hypothetical protein